MSTATLSSTPAGPGWTPDQRTLMAVLAHPDDESFGMGGTLALYARRGVSVHLVTATGGEAGTVEARHLDGQLSVAELRTERELRCAAEILGLSGLHLLNYRDSGMPGTPDNHHPRALAAQPVEEVAARIAEILCQVRPQVVITHDPIGGYRHPDHIAVHQATVRAFHDLVAGAQEYKPQKLYFITFQRGFFRWLVRLAPLFRQDPRHFGRNKDIDLIALTEEPDFPIHAAISIREARPQKEAASACHASQLDSGPPQRGPVAWLFRAIGSKEMYMRAYPPPEPGLRENDLFAGVF